MVKRNIIIIAIFIIAVILLVISQKKEEIKKLKEHNYIFQNLDFKNIKSISIKNYTIVNKEGKWEINNVECNKHRIEYLINYLKRIDFDTVISNKKENYPEFKVDDKKATKVKIITDKKTYNLWIGKFTPDGNGCYVRLDNGNVYLLNKNLIFEFDKKSKYFYLEKIKNKKKYDNNTKDNITKKE